MSVEFDAAWVLVGPTPGRAPHQMSVELDVAVAWVLVGSTPGRAPHQMSVELDVAQLRRAAGVRTVGAVRLKLDRTVRCNHIQLITTIILCVYSVLLFFFDSLCISQR